MVGLLLTLFFFIDSYLYRKDGHSPPDPTPDNPLGVSGGVNFVLMAVIIGALLFSASVDVGSVHVFGITFLLQNFVRDAVMVGVVFASIAWTSSADHDANGFSWVPMVEVAKRFAWIFVTIIPVIAMLQAGSAGSFALLVNAVTNLDGTPNHAALFLVDRHTVVIFGQCPGLPGVLRARGWKRAKVDDKRRLDTGCYFGWSRVHGREHDIGNAPNFMVYSIVRKAASGCRASSATWLGPLLCLCRYLCS